MQAVETTRKERRQAEGLEKIRGPEWGITDLDFEADHTSYQRKEMQKEYHGAGKGVKPTAYRAAHQAGKPSAGGQAWMQEVSGHKIRRTLGQQTMSLLLVQVLF